MPALAPSLESAPMRRTFDDTPNIEPELLQELLEWAGARLVALPASGLRPGVPHVVWPEYSQDLHEVLEFRRAISVRALGPSAKEIPLMDEILLLPNLLLEPQKRRILHLRALVHPRTLAPLWPWPRLAKRLRSDSRTLRALHGRCLRELAQRLPESKIQRITQSFRDLTLSS